MIFHYCAAQCFTSSALLIRSVSVIFTLLWQETVSKAIYRRKIPWNFSFKGLDHDHQDKEHGNMKADMTWEEYLSIYVWSTETVESELTRNDMGL